MLNKVRRNIIKNTLLLSPAMLLASCQKNNKKNTNSLDKLPELNLNMVTSFPKNLPGTDIPAQKLAKNIENMSLGKIKINHHAAGELVPAFEVFDAVREGIADCAFSAPQYWISKNKAISFFGCVPGGMTSKEMFVWLNQGNGQKLWDELYGKYNLKAFPAGDTGTTMGGWFKKKIDTLDDFNGLKMRIPGLGGELINRIGGVSVNLSGGEVISSLKLGVLDAAEWAGPWPDMIMGFHKVAKYYYGPGIHEPNTVCEFMINKNLWENLPNEYQLIIKNASYASYIEVLSEYFFNNAKALKILQNQHKIEINHYPNEVIKKLFDLSKNIIEDNIKNDPIYNDIYKDWAQTINLFNEYHKFSDIKYMSLRLQNNL